MQEVVLPAALIAALLYSVVALILSFTASTLVNRDLRRGCLYTRNEAVVLILLIIFWPVVLVLMALLVLGWLAGFVVEFLGPWSGNFVRFAFTYDLLRVFKCKK